LDLEIVGNTNQSQNSNVTNNIWSFLYRTLLARENYYVFVCV